MKLKTWVGTHPEEVTDKASAFIESVTVHQFNTVKHEREFIITILYSEQEQTEPKPKPMRCG